MSNFQHHFPFERLPKAGNFPLPLFQAAVRECINDRKVPIKMPYYAAAAACCAAAQSLVDVGKPAGGTVGTNLYTLVSAASGERKTDVRRDFFAAFDQINTELKCQFDQAMFDYLKQVHIWQRVDKALTSVKGQSEECVRARIAEHYQHKPVHPCPLKVSIKEPDYAPLMRALTDFPCMTIISGDCASYLRSTILRYDTAFCDVWSGEKIDDPRVSVDNYYCEHPRLGMFLMIQPKKLAALLKMGLGQAGNDSGLFARMIFVDADSTQGGRFLSIDTIHTPVSTHGRDAFNRNLKALLREGVLAMRAPGYCRKVLRFGRDAADMWLRFYNYVEEQRQPGGCYERVKDLASKLPDNVARMAAGLHVAERFKGEEIGMECMLSAIALCFESSRDYERTFVPEDQDEANALKLHEWLVDKLRAQPAREGVRLRREHDFRYISTISKYAPGRRMRGKSIHGLLAILARKGLLETSFVPVGRGQTAEKVRLLDASGS